MGLGGAIVGGSYTFESEGPFPVPIFNFRAGSVARVKELIANQVLTFEVRYDAQDRLAYHLMVPDAPLEPASIPIAPKDELAVASGQGIRDMVTTRVVDDEGSTLELDEFTRGLTHDFSGTYARAWRLFTRAQTEAPGGESLAVAIDLLRRSLVSPDARDFSTHHLLARCQAARGDVAASIDSFVQAVQSARRSWTDPRLIPAAASPLTDLGLLYQAQAMPAEAAICFEHALHLRPNHPAALLGLVRVAPLDAPRALHALARVAAIGGREAELATCAQIVAAELGTSAEDLVRNAKADASKVDLATWPYARDELGDHDHFVERVREPEGGAIVDEAEPPAEVLGYRDAPHTARTAATLDEAPPPASVPAEPKRPWWKIW